MKRKTLIVILALGMVMASAVMCFAEPTLKIATSYPKNGQKNTSMENLGVKVYFNNEVNSDKNEIANTKAVSLVDEKGEKVPIKVLFSDKEKKMMLAVADLTNSKYKVLNNAKYKLVIGPTFKDNNGISIGKEQTISFQTFNQKVNTWVNMGMMAVMFGGLFLVSARTAKKSEEEDKKAEETFNPYKEAKRSGKSVDEIMAEKAKKEAKKAKKKGKNKEEHEYEKHIENCAELLVNVYHVHAPAPTNKADRSIEALTKMRKEQKAAAKSKKTKKKKK